MRRVNVFTYPDPDDTTGETHHAGWFDLDKAEEFGEATYWNGNNHISVNTSSQWDHEALYRTAAGRWVLHTYSNRQGTRTTWRFVDDTKAKSWLLVNEHDDAALERFFGEIEPERGPGRPAIDGGTINFKPGAGLLDRIDAYAAAQGSSRADALRELLDRTLTTATPDTPCPDWCNGTHHRQ